MQQNFSPRSYVFNGLDIMRNPLIEFIYDQISNEKNWFIEHIVKAIPDNERIYLPGSADSLDGLYEVLDELKCFHVLEAQINFKYFKDIDIYLVYGIRKIRNKCVHGIIYGKDAEEALAKMIHFMGNIDQNCAKDLSYFRKKMINQMHSSKITATKKELIDFLHKNIWEPSFKLLASRNDIEDSQNLKDNMNYSFRKCHGFDTAEEILEWFNDHLVSSNGHTFYKRIKTIGLPTFEDYRSEFWDLCYGNKAKRD